MPKLLKSLMSIFDTSSPLMASVWGNSELELGFGVSCIAREEAKRNLIIVLVIVRASIVAKRSGFRGLLVFLVCPMGSCGFLVEGFTSSGLGAFRKLWQAFQLEKSRTLALIPERLLNLSICPTYRAFEHCARTR